MAARGGSAFAKGFGPIKWRQATAAQPVVAKTGGFGAVPLGFATDAPRGSAGSFTGGDKPAGYQKSFHSRKLW